MGAWREHPLPELHGDTPSIDFYLVCTRFWVMKILTKSFLRPGFLVPFFFVNATLAAEHPFISEFLTINESETPGEGAGQSYPWIEICHPGPGNALSLDGYFLTNDRNDLKKWALPAATLQVNAFAIVIASGQGRAGGSPWHANFTLSEEDDYLALVGPDGVPVDEYKDIPEQEPDVAYGREMKSTVSRTTLIESGASSKVLVPDSEIGRAWVATGFDDAGWLSANTGLGIERGRGYENLFGKNGDLTRRMYGINASVYVRIPFDLTTVPPGVRLVLRMKYDDGFVAYVNGAKVAQVNAPNRVRYNSGAVADNPDTAAVVFEDFDITEHVNRLRRGKNVLAIHGLNGGTASSDLLILPELQFVRPAGATLGAAGYLPQPTPGESNGQSYKGFADEVTASQPHGFYEDPFELTLESEDDGIRYTLDGSEPTIDSPAYTSPLTISGTTILRTAAINDGYKPTVSTYSYFFLNDVIDQSADGSAPPGWPSAPVNRQVFNYGMDPQIVGQLHPRAEVIASLKAIPTVSIAVSMDDFAGASKGIYVNALQHGRAWERPISLEMIFPDGTKGFQINAGLRVRGGYTRSPWFYKHGFRTFFRKAYGEAKLKYPVFGAEGADRFDNLDFRTTANHSWARNAASDSDPTKHTFVRDVFARDTQAIIGQPYTRSRYYHLYINGIYWGVYQSQERPKAAYGETYFGGEKEEFDAVKCANRVAGYHTEATDGNMEAWNELWELAVAMRNQPAEATYFKMMGRDATGRRDLSLPVLLDPENLIDYMLIIFFMGDGDAPMSRFLRYRKANNWHSLYHREGDQGFQFFCHDGEHTMDVPTAVYDRTGPLTAGPQSQPYSNPEWIHENLVSSAEYRLLFADRIHRHFFNGGALTPETTIERFQRRARQVGPAMIAHSARWGDAQGRRRFTKSDWEAAIDNVVRSFLPTRASIVLNQLKEDQLYPNVIAPSFSPHGGEVRSEATLTISGNQGDQLIYTTDGSDPRLLGGKVNSKGIQSGSHEAALTLDQSVTVQARMRTPRGDWSALVSARFLVDEVAARGDNLRITEIMYRPAQATDAEERAGHDDRGDFEFVELSNIGSHAINLTDVSFTNGIYFDFNAGTQQTLGPGEHLLLVKNRAAFEFRYGKERPIAGEYSGSLSNDGEPLGIRAADLTSITELVYNDKAPWPEEADGDGYSLVFSAPGKSPGEAASWSRSKRKGGSPGVSDL